MNNIIMNHFTRKRWIYSLPYFLLFFVLAFFVILIVPMTYALAAKEDRVYIYPKKGLTVAISKQVRGKEAGDILRTFSEFNRSTVNDGEYVIYKLSIKNNTDQTVSFYNPELYTNHLEYNGLNFTNKMVYNFFPFFNIDYHWNLFEIKPLNYKKKVVWDYPTLPDQGEWQDLFPPCNIIDIEPGKTREGCILFDKEIDGKTDKELWIRSKNTIYIFNTFYLPFGDKPAK